MATFKLDFEPYSADSEYGSMERTIDTTSNSATTGSVYSPQGYDGYTMDYQDTSYIDGSTNMSPAAFKACDLFDEVIGSIPDKAREASDAAMLMLKDGDSIPGPTLLSIDPVIPPERHFDVLDAPVLYRKAVQHALHDYLYGALTCDLVDFGGIEQSVNKGITEAAYKLQREININICYFAISDILAQLREELVEKDKPHSSGASR
ncbi:hypothetical protein GQ53DRAFT_827832 [Thozetella sp. PMI_491]|nr:hypothetical protein GQ53DRAFT_827832 [Thozetella sp. PMI_491]